MSMQLPNPSRIILRHAVIEWTEGGCRNIFDDGTTYDSIPHDTHHYHVIAHRCGYGDDIMTYCREHDFFHLFCEQYFHDRASPVLLGLAHGKPITDPYYEEVFAMTAQRWVRANERPMVGDVNWDEFKRRALVLLDMKPPMPPKPRGSLIYRIWKGA